MERIYTLMHGDTRLGLLTLYEIDQPWFNCRFEAEAAFEEIRPLFDAELQAMEAEPALETKHDKWEKAYDAIDALNLYLVSNAGETIGPMLLHIRDDEAWFRY